MIYNIDLDITYADALDHVMSLINRNLSELNKKIDIETYKITIDDTTNSILYNDERYEIDNNINIAKYDIENSKLVFENIPKEKQMVILKNSISRVCLFAYKDRSKDKTYVFTLDRMFNRKIINIEPEYSSSNINVIKRAFDRWDQLILFMNEFFSYYLITPIKSEYDLYSDILSSHHITLDILKDEKIVPIKQKVDIYIKEQTEEPIEFRLMFMNNIEQIKDYFDIYSNTSNISTELVLDQISFSDDGYVMYIQPIKNTKIKLIPKELERMLVFNAFARLNNAIEINIY